MASSRMEPSSMPSLASMTIEQAVHGLENGHFTSSELTHAFLTRIDEASGFKAVLQTNPDALKAAQALDKERQSSGGRGPLHGVPILVKDSIVTKDPLEASAGSFALLGAKPAQESTVVARLRAAGALILGKTNMGEWSNFRGYGVPNGWSPRGGQTLSSYYPGGDPGGSSSGSAVATSLGLCLAALGAETAGSIVFPAELNNVVGLKPTRGLIATDGAIPISGRQDTVGTLTRTVKDAAYMLSNMAGRGEKDSRTWNIPFDPVPDYTAFCDSTDLSGLTVGVPRNAIGDDVHPALMEAFEAALQTLRSAGATVVDHTNFSGAEEYAKISNEVKNTLRSAEFKEDIVKYIKTLASNPNEIHSLDDIIHYTRHHSGEDFPAKNMDNFLWTQSEKTVMGDSTYVEISREERYYGGEGGILGALEKHKLDVLVTPTWLNHANDVAARMGFPVMSVPLGFFPEGTEVAKGIWNTGDLVYRAPGIPFALTFISKAFSEDKIFRAAYSFEQLSAVRKNGPPPINVPKTELADARRVLQKI